MDGELAGTPFRPLRLHRIYRLRLERDGDRARLFWAAEGSAETADPGFDPHLAPDPTPLWNVLDWTPGGRGTNWYPKLSY